MRYINDIIVHCSGTKAIDGYGVEQIREYHKNEKHWADIGYHYVVTTDGQWQKGRPVSRVGAHCKGRNAHSIGVCYVGGIDENGEFADTRTPAQKATLLKEIYNLVQMYRCSVHGHHDYNLSKPCPCFDANAEYGQFYKHLLVGKK